MPKFKAKVTIKAEYEYEAEVEEDTEAKAEDTASRQWREKMPEDFQVEKGYITELSVEAEQQTDICPDCGTEHTIPTADNTEADSWSEDYEYCKPCGAKIELKEKQNG